MPTERTRRIFISDIHPSSEQAYRPENSQPLSWLLPERDGERLLNFLEASIIQNGADIKDVILLGDVFNSWVWPADQAPPRLRPHFREQSARFGKRLNDPE